MIEPQVVLEPIAADQAFVLANLFELYVHDFSEQVPLELKPNGRFDLPVDDCWWNSSEHFPFFIRLEGQLLGFALVRRGSRVTAAADVMDVAEFFVVRGARRRGVGRSAARALFSAFPGHWEIRVRQSNRAASTFWQNVAQCWLREPAPWTAFSVAGVDWQVLQLPVPADSMASDSQR
jgi:predicted acetyltransferase